MVALVDAGDGFGAIALAEGLTAVTAQQVNLKRLIAAAYTDGGSAVGDPDLAQHGADLWRELGPDSDPAIRYNLANAELAVFQSAVRRDDLPAAWEAHRQQLHAARSAYLLVGTDPKVSRNLRLQSLSNAGNAYDIVGRDLEARTLWDMALAIDPGFGMALGNRGISLARYAPFMRGHSPSVRSEAVADLDAALEAHASVLTYGGPGALMSFKSHRAKLAGVKGRRPAPGRAAWSDPHLRWCLKHELFLHVSHSCLREDTRRLDPLAFRSLIVGLGDADQERVRDLVDMLNAIKEDYMAARFATWLATADESPARSVASSVSRRAVFLDSLRYARFGVRTGLAIQAFGAATNVLDKVAVLVHAYLGTSRPAGDIYFRWLARSRGQAKGRVPKPMDAELQVAVGPPERNLGLIALCDLSCELEGGDTLLKRFAGRRHAATHRFLVAHTELVPQSTEWIERLRWPELVSESITQLKLARAAIVYLVRAIDRHEANRRPRDTAGSPMPLLEIPTIDTEFIEHN